MEAGDSKSSGYRRACEKNFIVTYGSFPVLWDRSHPNYGNYWARIAALRELLPIYRKIKPMAGLEDVRRKINVLRSNYNREWKKSTMSRNVSQKRSWKFDCLRFLDKGEGDYGLDEDITIDEEPTAIKKEPSEPTEESTEETMLQMTSNILAKPADEFQIFGEFVASELRNLQSVAIQRKLKLVIQRAIIECTELDLEIESPSSKSCIPVSKK